MSVITKKTSSWPVVEVFGPTIQGEGIDQGAMAHFVRFGGCDYKCDWCDTPYAVLPAEVRKNSTKMTARDIDDALGTRPFAPWVILTGGNPALHDLSDLVATLRASGHLVAVETQGSRWREWFRACERICVSPKPPSAKESKSTIESLHRFMSEALHAKATGFKPYNWIFLKIVCFTEEDLDYAVRVRDQFSDLIMYLSAGNDAGATVGNPDRVDDREIDQVRLDLADMTVWLFEEVAKRPTLRNAHDVFIQHQLHTMMWGNGRGF